MNSLRSFWIQQIKYRQKRIIEAGLNWIRRKMLADRINLILITMNLILILTTLFVFTSTQHPQAFYTGLMKFSNDQRSSLHQIGKVPKPVSILSMSQLSYSGSFALRTTRKLFKRNKQYYIQVNTTSSLLSDSYIKYSVTIQYMITRQLDNMQVFTLNLTTKKPRAFIKPKHLNTNKSQCIVFPLGFTNSTLVDKLTAHPKEGSKFLVYSPRLIENTLEVNWIQVQVVVVQEKFTKCGSALVSEWNVNVDSQYFDRRRVVGRKAKEVQFVMGIQELHDGFKGSLDYDAQNYTVNFREKGFKYAVVPVNTTCIYTKQKSGYSVVFIVFFSIFTGIFGVVLIAFVAYCLIKQWERRRKISNNSQVGLNQANIQLQIDKDVINDNMNVQINAPTVESQSQAGGTERKLNTLQAVTTSKVGAPPSPSA